jgi:hypothetical protein
MNKSRCQHTDRKTNHDKKGGTPGRLGRQPARRKQSPDFAPQPSALFLSIEGIFQAGPTHCQHCGIGFGPVRSEQCEQIPFPDKLRRAVFTLRKMLCKPTLPNRIQLVPRSEKNQRRLPFAALLAGHFVPARTGIFPTHPENPAYLMSSRLARNFLVARNREFFTVSSDVPKSSPIARSLSPW